MTRVIWFYSMLIVVLAAVVLAPVSPIYRPVPDIDQSVYLYVADRMLDGEMPYRDVWDHKQPLTYLLYAAGLALSGGTLWGIWVIELVFLAVTGLLIFRIIVQIAPFWLAFTAVASGLLTLVILIWGYSVEELALPFQAAAFTCLVGLVNRRRTAALSILLGVLMGMTFLLKQNLLAVGLAGLMVIGLRAVIRREIRGLRILAGSAAGFLGVCGLALIWLAANGALRDYYNAAFAFNLSYAGLGLVERLNAVLDGLEYISGVPGLFLTFGLWVVIAGAALLQNGPLISAVVRARYLPVLLVAGGIFLIMASLGAEVVSSSPGLGLLQSTMLGMGALSGILGGLFYLRPYLRTAFASRLCDAPVLANPEGSETNRILVFLIDTCALLFPLTVLLIGLSGRNYVYYFIPLVLVTMLMIGVTGGLLHAVAGGPSMQRLGMLVLLGLCAALAYNPLLALTNGYRAERNPATPAIAEYVQRNTSSQDTILAWGKYTTYAYYAADRKAPTRFFYQAAVAEMNYAEEFGVNQEMLRGLQDSPPALFLVSFNPDPAAGTQADICLPGGSPGNMILEWMCSAYHYDGAVDEFLVYQLER